VNVEQLQQLTQIQNGNLHYPAKIQNGNNGQKTTDWSAFLLESKLASLSKDGYDDLDDCDLETAWSRQTSGQSQMSMDSQDWSYPPGWDEADHTGGLESAEYSSDSPDSSTSDTEESAGDAPASTIGAPASSPTRKWADMIDDSDTEERDSHLWCLHPVQASTTSDTSSTHKLADMTNLSFVVHNTFLHFGEDPLEADTGRRSASVNALGRRGL